MTRPLINLTKYLQNSLQSVQVWRSFPAVSAESHRFTV